MTGVVVDTCLPFDHDGNPWEGPQVRLKARRLRASAKHAINALQSLGVQARFAPRAPRALEAFDPTMPVA
jgi:hypothetical protein